VATQVRIVKQSKGQPVDRCDAENRSARANCAARSPQDPPIYGDSLTIVIELEDGTTIFHSQHGDGVKTLAQLLAGFKLMFQGDVPTWTITVDSARKTITFEDSSAFHVADARYVRPDGTHSALRVVQ
jgi:hypothetical protein